MECYEDGCGYGDGDGNQICCKCAKSKKLVRTCGNCRGLCCKECLKSAGSCCGRNLCSRCTDEHVKNKRSCGHLGCNNSDEEGISCRTCTQKQKKEAKAKAAAGCDDVDDDKQPAKKAKSEVLAAEQT